MDSLLPLLRDIEKTLDKSDFYGGIISNVFGITKCLICNFSFLHNVFDVSLNSILETCVYFLQTFINQERLIIIIINNPIVRLSRVLINISRWNRNVIIHPFESFSSPNPSFPIDHVRSASNSLAILFALGERFQEIRVTRTNTPARVVPRKRRL